MKKYLTLENVLHCCWALLSAGIIMFGTYLFNQVTSAQESRAATEVKIVEQDKQSATQFKLLQEQIDRRFGELSKQIDKIDGKLDQHLREKP